MNANVACAGGGQTARDPCPFGFGPTHYERPTNGKPCGWKGERNGWFNGRTWEHVNLALPCPRCGGKVTLIEDGER